MKKFSFLFCEEPIKGRISDIAFPMKDIINYCVSGETKRTFVNNVFSQFDNNVKNILFRQELVRDLINNDGLLNDLIKVMEKLDESKILYSKSITEYREARKHMIGSVITFREIMHDSAILLLELIKVYTRIGNTLDRYHYSSTALKKMEEHIHGILNNDSLNRIKELITDAVFSVDKISVLLNNDLKIINADFIINDDKSRNKRVTIPMSNKSLDEYNFLYNSAAKDTVDIILNICYYLIDYFRDCSGELWFYEFAMKYHKLLKGLNIPYSFPTISPTMSFKNLYELNLLISKDKDEEIEIKPNSFYSDDTSGCVIVGPNNSGKTVFIRSLASAIILGQAGLFVPAEEASISIKKNMHILYATIERNEQGGRFEQEVRAMSEAINQLESNDLVIMNEYFQSTMEREGINILYDLFSFLAKKNIYWIAVTNFQSIVSKQNLFEKETGNSFKVLMTNMDHEVKEIGK